MCKGTSHDLKALGSVGTTGKVHMPLNEMVGAARMSQPGTLQLVVFVDTGWRGKRRPVEARLSPSMSRSIVAKTGAAMGMYNRQTGLS